MALGIGASTSLFTIVRSVLLKPLPFRDPDKLVMLYEHFRQDNQVPYNVVAPADFYDWREKTHGYQDMAACDKAKKGQQTCAADAGTTGAGTSQSTPIGNSGGSMKK
jgi:hypothetical protein